MGNYPFAGEGRIDKKPCMGVGKQPCESKRWVPKRENRCKHCRPLWKEHWGAICSDLKLKFYRRKRTLKQKTVRASLIAAAKQITVV